MPPPICDRRGGSGAPAAKREQAEIIRLLTASASR
jgi:hypothetical protein